MDQKKVGAFMKDLRKEKGITQEQLAEVMNVSGRTVSRWETGSNLPDIDILIELADYYNVEIREILNGERKSDMINEEVMETVIQVADLVNDEKEKVAKRMHWCFILGVVCFLMSLILGPEGMACEGVLKNLGEFLKGISLGIMIMGALYTSRHMHKIREAKLRLLKRK